MVRTRNLVTSPGPVGPSLADTTLAASRKRSKQKLHVLEIIGNAIVGGMESHVELLVRHLPSDGFRITCLLPFESPFTARLRSLGCDVWITQMEEDPPWRSIQFAVELIRQGDVDLVHAHVPRAHVLAGLAGRITQRPVVATLHTQNVPGQDVGIQHTADTSLITVCQAAYSQALALGVPPDAVTLIPNGVDTTMFGADATGTDFRTSLAIPMGVPLVGWVGRLSIEKGPDLFVQLAEHVHRSRDDVQFVLVGDGLMEGQLAGMIRDRGLEDCVHLAGTHTDMPSVYAALDVCVLTSRSEGSPLSLLEAMACRRPVLAMAVGGVPEAVEHTVTGFLVGPGDWAGLGGMLLGLLNHPDRLERLGRAGRTRVEQLFDVRRSAERTGELFERLARPVAIKQAAGA